MEIIKENKDDLTVIQVDGNVFTDVDAQVILTKVQESIDDGKSNIVFDLSKTKFVNSSGLGAFVTAMTKSRKSGGDMVLANVPKMVSSLLVTTKLDSIINQMSNLEEAKSFFDNK